MTIPATDATPAAIEAVGIRVAFDPEGGRLDGFAVTDGGREVAPLHRAPWAGTDERMPQDAPPLLARLGGDFLCAPFGTSEGSSGLHGWPANGRWTVVHRSGGTLRAVLDHPVMGATVLKELSVEDGHPFVYQRHLFVGGSGRLPVANHANVSLPDGGLIRTSPKSGWETLASTFEPDPERGRSALLYPARAKDPRHFPGASGDDVDLTRYPWGPCHEDFAIGVEATGHRLGWTAVTRIAQGDLYLSLRDATSLPMTMLWHSNGGRDYAPWLSRHFGCLGVEEGAAGHMLGVSGEADLPAPGAILLRPDATADVRHVIGAIAWPEGGAVADIEEDGGAIVVRGDGGKTRRLPFREGFLGRDAT